jgi:hypothetical protein
MKIEKAAAFSISQYFFKKCLATAKERGDILKITIFTSSTHHPIKFHKQLRQINY